MLNALAGCLTATLDAQYEIGELKQNLRQQQVVEEIRRTELYNALLKGQSLMTQPPEILPKVQGLYDDIDEVYAGQGRKSTNMYRKNEDEEFYGLLASQSKLVKPDVQEGRYGRFVEADDKPYARSRGYNKSVYDFSEDHHAIKFNGSSRGLDHLERFDDYEKEGAVGEILRKNKERLDILDDLEDKEFGISSRKEYAKRYSDRLDDEAYQMIRGSSRGNNPRRYIDEL